MDEECLKRTIFELRERYWRSWKDLSGNVNELLEELRGIILSKEDISTNQLQKIKEIQSSLYKILKSSVFKFRAGNYSWDDYQKKFLNNKEFRKLLNKIHNVRDVKDIVPLEKDISQLIGNNLTGASTWMCVVNPEIVIPANISVFSNSIMERVLNRKKSSGVGIRMLKSTLRCLKF